MGLLITSIILSVIVFLVIGFLGVVRETSFINKYQFLALAPFVILVFGMFVFIPANTVGIEYNPFKGGVQNVVLQEGFKTKNLFSQIHQISTEVQSANIQGLFGQTKDAQFLTVALDVKYSVDKENSFKVFKTFRTLDNVAKQLIQPTAKTALEKVTCRYNIIELLGDKTDVLYNEMHKELSEKLSASGLTLYSMSFVDKDAGQAIEAAIAADGVAKKAVETALKEKEKAVIEADKAVAVARGEADSKVIMAEGNAKAYALMNREINDGILKKMWIEKWDGKLSTVTTGNGQTMYNLGNLGQ